MKLTKQMFDLISETESMSSREKQYWIEIWPAMTDEQQLRLFTILRTEKTKLSVLEHSYQQDLADINTKILAQWR